MLARMRGARSARGDVLVFLDAHCEPVSDWLRPLLQRVKEKRDVALTPVIDVIDQSTFALEAADHYQVGGFTFAGHFTWIDVPGRERIRRGSDIAPTWSPTMAGGLFAINRAYYWELGGYDEMMGGWGGENLEMSFRTWMCGGTLETIPCSRVGHVFRAFHPYGLPGSSDTHGINTARMAEVWMDEYAELFYLHRPDLRKSPKIGDVTHRKVLREKLHCKSFRWYLDNIYPEKFVPVRDVVAYGRFQNKPHGMCLDNLQRERMGAPLGVYPCHPRLLGSQHFMLSLTGQLRDEEKCAEVDDSRTEAGHKVVMMPCKDHRMASKRQQWSYEKGRIRHVSSNLCLTAQREPNTDVLASRCDGRREQDWAVDYSQETGFTRADNNDYSGEYPEAQSSEHKERIEKIRRHSRTHRISRSLLSVDPANQTPHNATLRRARRRKHKRRAHRRRNRNKFILRIERTAPPPTGPRGAPLTEHLELDVRCPHRKLYPNDTFVRDLVSVLNMHDIRVINNGRIFEKNRVSQLPRGDKKERPRPAAAEHMLRQNMIQMKQPGLRPGKQPRLRKQKRPPLLPPPGPAGRAPAALQPPPTPPMLPPAMVAPIVGPPRADNKIIVEDFVEMATTEANTKKQQYAKEWHKLYPAKQRYHLRKRNKQQSRVRASPPSTEPPSPASPSPAPDPAPPTPAPSVPQSARDALLALLGEKIDKATRGAAASKEYSPRHDAARAPQASSGKEGSDTQSSGEEVPLLLPESVETWNTANSRSRNESFRRDLPASGSDELVQKLNMYHARDASQDLDNEIRELHTERRSHGHPASSDEAEKRPTSDEAEPSERDEQAGEHVGERKRGKPVKVTMRNNFTFNIGDEFFSWRTNNDDVADILGSLAIPSNSSPAAPPLEAWVRPAPHSPPAPALFQLPQDHAESSSSSAEDATLRLLTGRGVGGDSDDTDEDK